VRFTLYRGLVFGIMLVAVVLACPSGLVGGAVWLYRCANERTLAAVRHLRKAAGRGDAGLANR
jgi:hypothetical protein